MANITHIFPAPDDPLFTSAFVVSFPIQLKKSPEAEAEAEVDEENPPPED